MRVPIPKKLGILFEPHRYKVLHGGRGGGKSWTVAAALLVLAMQARLRILCTREYQVSIADSVHRILKDQIVRMKLGDWFVVQKSCIRCANGSEFLFKGIGNDPEQIKSTEGVDICWVEEAQSVSAASWKILEPTIRKDGSEIWVCFNPRYATDPTYKKFIATPPDNAKVVQILWHENPWFPDVLRKLKDQQYATDPDLADHIWKGVLETRSDAQILHGKWVVEQFTASPDWNGPYYGADWGFVDATVLVRCWVAEVADPGQEMPLRDLYVDYEASACGVDNDDLPALFDEVPGAREHTIRADSARPETISHMRSHGYPLIVGVKKGPGSVANRISHFRSYRRIVIHPRCEGAAEEARLWRWKIDKLTGDILPIPVDDFNHRWDAAGYALEPLISGYGGGPVDISEPTGGSTWDV